MTWEVQTLTLCGGWVNTWTVCIHGQDAIAQTFETREDAETALAEFLEEVAFAASRGDIDEPEDPSNYAIFPVARYLSEA